MAASRPTTLLKGLIWTYLVLLLTEGALRKWVLPGMDKFLLVARDPLVVLIYFVALSSGRFVINGFVTGAGLLAVTTFFASLMVPTTNIYVTLIGLRCYFLHLPLIFVMERTLEREDLYRMGKFFLWFALPETILLVLQFYSSQNDWVNRSVGGKVDIGMAGALDRYRPSGTFSFVTGVAQFYPLTLAMLLSFLLNRQRLPWYLSVTAAACLVISVPFSISRSNALTCALVLLVGGGTMLVIPKPPKLVMRTIFVAGLVTLIISLFPQFDEGVTTFEARWGDATGRDMQGFRSNIIGRYFGDLLPDPGLFYDTPLFGAGVGFGTIMAQAFLTGQRQFIIGESEWTRVLLEMGPVLGLAFITLRIFLSWKLVLVSFAALRRQNILPMLFVVEAVLLVLNAQWGQSTTLGFATFTAGLTLAASRVKTTATVSTKAKKRRGYARRPSWGPPSDDSASDISLPAPGSPT